LLEKLKKAGKAQLYDQVSQAGREFDSMSQDLQNKIANITGDLDGLLKTIDN
jgi:predicted  nucleic acid-binding Zn-ribbon protein